MYFSHLISSKTAAFIKMLYDVYVDLYFTYLEVNPLVITSDDIYILDLAAKLDATAEFVCKAKWGDVEYPPPFGRDALPEEAFIADLDSKSGASLKVWLLFSFWNISLISDFAFLCLVLQNCKGLKECYVDSGVQKLFLYEIIFLFQFLSY